MKLITALLLLVTASATAQWHRLPGPPAGGPRAYVQSSDGKKIYAGTSDGIWQAPDIHGPWSPLGFRGQDVSVLANFYFSGQGDIFFVAIDSVLWRSIDTGKSWQAFHNVRREQIAGIFLDGNTLAVATNVAFYRSTDAGTTWSGADGTPAVGNNYYIAAETPTYYFAVSVSNELWRMWRKGGTWEKTSFPSWQQVLGMTTLGSNLFIGSDGRVWLSTDNGNSWISTLSYGLDTTKDDIQSLAVSGLTFVATSTTGVFTSTDGARTWTRAIEADDSYSATFIDSTFVISRTSAGMFASPDGITWSPVSIPSRALSIRDVATSKKGLFAITQGGSVYRSSDRGNTWSSPARTSLLTSLVTADSTVFALGDHDISMWEDTGWRKINSDLPVSSFAAVKDTFFLSDGNGSIYRSENGGGYWHALMNLPSVQTYQLQDYKLACIGDTVLALGQFQIGDEQLLYLSSDRGETWVLRHEFPQEYNVIDVAASEHMIAVQLVDQLQVSSDNGWSWKSYHQEGTAVAVVGNNAIAALTTTNPVGIYNATKGLALIEGDTFTNEISSMASDDSDLYVATARQGIWANAINDLPLSVSVGTRLQSLRMQLYPNPSHGSSMLTFALSQRSDVRLDVFNELGETVFMEDLGMFEAGEQSLPIPTSLLMSGIYSVRISSDTFATTARLIVSH